MKESQFGFEYSWADMKPIRALSVIVLGAQVLGCVAGLLLAPFPKWFDSLWFGGAVGTLPAFLVGLLVQSRLRPGSVRENEVMVRRLGLIAAALTAFAVAMPFIWVRP
jgi:hypothetical protein